MNKYTEEQIQQAVENATNQMRGTFNRDFAKWITADNAHLLDQITFTTELEENTIEVFNEYEYFESFPVDEVVAKLESLELLF